MKKKRRKGHPKTPEHRIRISEAMRRSWRERRRHICYGGSITGLAPEVAAGWRRAVRKTLEAHGVVFLDPLRRDEGHEPGKPIGHATMSAEKATEVCAADLHDIDLSTVVLLNLAAGTVSIGSHTEAGYAMARRKPLVIVASEEVRTHPFVQGIGAQVFATLDEAIAHIVQTYGREST